MTRVGKGTAFANIALIKYWGKRDAGPLNLPAVGSWSLCLDGLRTETRVTPAEQDSFALNGEELPFPGKAANVLGQLRERAGSTTPLRVQSENLFPTAAGLASSASGGAALVEALCAALSLELTTKERSIFARQVSGSAARSVSGGVSRWNRGYAADGHDCYAEQVFGPDYWPLRVCALVVDRGPKALSSTEGMKRSQDTAPGFGEWVAKQPEDIVAFEDFYRARDFAALAELVEANTLRMHALCHEARPTFSYWATTTEALLEEVRRLRRAGSALCFTVDAGPQVKVVYEASAAAAVAALCEYPGVVESFDSGIAGGSSGAAV